MANRIPPEISAALSLPRGGVRGVRIFDNGIEGSGQCRSICNAYWGALGESLGHMVTTRFKLTVLNKSVVLYCNRPDTNLHCRENSITDDSLRLKLTPFV